VLSTSSARAHDSQEAIEGLVADVERVVAAEEAGGWFLDREELGDLYPALLESVCRASEEARRGALGLLERRVRAAGDARAVYEASGRQRTSSVERALTAERRRRALELAMQGAGQDCPFWAQPDADFLGRQTDRNRFTLSLETGGMAQLRQTAGTWTLGGGGIVRLLPGYGFGGVSLLAGVEFGGGAMIRPQVQPTEFVINYFPALPVLVRFHDVSWHYDFELAPVALFQADDGDFSYGGRVGFSTGVFALRTRGVLPWAGAAVAYEHYVESGGRPSAHFFRGGLRVGVVWDATAE
jgi:hypothetical protein